MGTPEILEESAGRLLQSRCLQNVHFFAGWPIRTIVEILGRSLRLWRKAEVVPKMGRLAAIRVRDKPRPCGGRLPMMTPPDFRLTHQSTRLQHGPFSVANYG